MPKLTKSASNDKLEHAMDALRSVDLEALKAADDHVIDEFIELVRFYLSDMKGADAEWKAWFDDYERWEQERIMKGAADIRW